jgi:hypothetical protein
VSHSCACIGSPCLSQCVHDASIGGGGGAPPALSSPAYLSSPALALAVTHVRVKTVRRHHAPSHEAQIPLSELPVPLGGGPLWELFRRRSAQCPLPARLPACLPHPNLCEPLLPGSACLPAGLCRGEASVCATVTVMMLVCLLMAGSRRRRRGRGRGRGGRYE